MHFIQQVFWELCMIFLLTNDITFAKKIDVLLYEVSQIRLYMNTFLNVQINVVQTVIPETPEKLY
jgi:hypothetical protein